MGNDVGTRSKHNGVLQSERQSWLNKRAERLRTENGGYADAVVEQEGGKGENISPVSENADGVKNGEGKEVEQEREAEGMWQSDVVSMDERLHRLEIGEELWGATYVPPIAPERKEELIVKWSAPSDGEDKDQCVSQSLFLYALSDPHHHDHHHSMLPSSAFFD